MNERHLIALDLDGTLLTEEKTISKTTKEVIQSLMQAGHVVVIATGRSKRMSIKFYQELHLNTPLINSNGAVLHHPLSKSWGQYHTPLDLGTAIEIVEASYALNGKNAIAALYDYIYLDQFDEKIVSYYGRERRKKDFIIGSLKDNLQENPTLMMLYPDENKITRLMAHLSQFHAETVDHWSWGEPYHIIEVMSNKISKGRALKKIADYYHIPRERIIAFGDGANDLDMIEFAHVGVAMANAIDELKTVAGYETKTNEEDGVATFLADYFSIPLPINIS